VPLNPGSASFPDDLDPLNVPPELKKEGSDWFAIFNPKVKRVLDVSLVHTLMHERYVLCICLVGLLRLIISRCSVVCCVRFSADGKFLATGCNRTAQIYDTKTGVKTWYGEIFCCFSVEVYTVIHAQRPYRRVSGQGWGPLHPQRVF
jgi:glucose repression regulatory protein TUP1